MTALPNTTKTRLKKIPQVPGVVWEGDRRPLGSMASHLNLGLEADGECILWVDGSEGAVMAMDVVAEDMGIEAVVRTLLRAIESPHHPGQPHRPQKIVVRDREIQFFLRGALQGLDINIEYSPQLPLIDRLFESFSEFDGEETSALPETYQEAIEDVAGKIWDNAPWELLADSDILQVELKNCQINEVYICIMGMMSAEFGVLLYRSLDSLKQFRAAALGENRSPAELEKAFLAQDCWFLNYEEIESKTKYQTYNVEPFFGSLHPFEGMRPFLDEEEAKIIYVVLESLLRFCDRNREILAREPIDAVAKSYRITLPHTNAQKEIISTKISTLPELTEELIDIGIGDYHNEIIEDFNEPIREDFVPDGSLISLTSLPKDIVWQLKHQGKAERQSFNIAPQQSELPTIFIQTTRPKAKRLIDKIKAAGGLKTVCFNPGEDPFGNSYNLGLLQTGDDELFIFAEYSQRDRQQIELLKNWHQKCKNSQGYCVLVVAMGATGNNRGNPQLKDMLAVYEVKSIDGSDINMGVLELVPND